MIEPLLNVMQPASPQRSLRDRDGGALRAEHDAQILLGQSERVSRDPIMGLGAASEPTAGSRPNGAGKSAPSLRIVATSLSPTFGRGSVLGFNLATQRHQCLVLTHRY